MTLSTVEDIYDLVVAEEDEHGCLIPTNDEVLRDSIERYAYLRIRKEHATAVGLDDDKLHRIVWRLSHDRQEIPTDMHIAHECGERYENKRCINSKHLHLRTPSENHSFKAPDVLLRCAKAGSDAVAKVYEDPIRRREISVAISAGQLRPETRRVKVESLKKSWDNPERRKAASERAKVNTAAGWKNEDIRKRMTEGLNKIYRCDECGYEKTATSVGRHQKKMKHTGRTLVSTPEKAG